MSQSCWQLMKARDKTKKVAKYNQDTEDWSHFKKLRNRVKNMVRKEREMDVGDVVHNTQ